MNGTIITVAHQAINNDFQISDARFPHSYWPTASWAVGGALFPLILYPTVEDHGVRPVVLGSYLLLVCLLIPIGLAPNFATLILVRFFSGGCVQLLGNAVAGIISNVFDGDRARSVPISLYVTTYLGATSLGPVIGASIFQSLSWRWIGYIELIWTAALAPILMIGLSESSHPALLRARAKRLRRERTNAHSAEELDRAPVHQILIRSIRRPLDMLFTESVALVAALWAAFSLGTIYLFTQSIEQVYGSLYGWDSVQAGYVQGAIVVGEVLGCALCVYSNRWYYASAAKNTETPGTPIPEARLYASMIGGFLGVTCGMFVYGWTSYSTVHWMVSTTAWPWSGLGRIM